MPNQLSKCPHNVYFQSPPHYTARLQAASHPSQAATLSSDQMLEEPYSPEVPAMSAVTPSPLSRSHLPGLHITPSHHQRVHGLPLLLVSIVQLRYYKFNSRPSLLLRVIILKIKSHNFYLRLPNLKPIQVTHEVRTATQVRLKNTTLKENFSTVATRLSKPTNPGNRVCMDPEWPVNLRPP